MANDSSRFTKLEHLPPSLQVLGIAQQSPVVVLVKLREGSEKPSYVTVRTHISKTIFSAEIDCEGLEQLEQDPSVESFSISRPIPVL